MWDKLLSIGKDEIGKAAETFVGSIQAQGLRKAADEFGVGANNYLSPTSASYVEEKVKTWLNKRADELETK